MILIGFMGTGKSSVGRELARRAGFEFHDTDGMIRKRHQLSVNEIFEKLGEVYFREQEYWALRSLLHLDQAVIATGGGIVIQPRNLPLLKQLGLIVWLRASKEVILQRVGRSNQRPLLASQNPGSTVDRLLAERNPLYQSAAHCSVDSSGLTHLEVADRVAEAILQRANGS